MRAPVLLVCLAASSFACAPRTRTMGASWAAPAPTASATTAKGGVLLTRAFTLGRPCETIAVVELHSRGGDEATGFAQLRRWATTIGGDAIVSARFDPATADAPAHVSGVVVRFKAADPRPFDVLAQLEVRTEPDAPDKGLEALRGRAREIGADKVIDVRFDRSPDGPSQLRGIAIRYRR